jgi:hypothetical protein
MTPDPPCTCIRVGGLPPDTDGCVWHDLPLSGLLIGDTATN